MEIDIKLRKEGIENKCIFILLELDLFTPSN